MLDPVMWVMYAVVLYITFFLVITLLDEGRIREEVKDIDEYPSLSLIIPAYNEEDTIEMAVESALSVNYPDDKYEVIVVDDGSTDGTLEKARQYQDEVTVLTKENGGKGSALNKGIRESDAEVVACVDADSRLEKDSLRHMAGEMSEGYVGVASAMKVADPSNFLQKLQWVEYIVGIFTRNIMGLMNAIHVTPGPLSMYRRKELLEVGLFDEDSLVEDQEICFRLQRQHHRIGHSSRAEVHTVAPSTWEEFKTQRYRWYRGSLETILQYREVILDREYGDFGMFAIPAKTAQTVLSLLLLFITVYLFGMPLVEALSQISQIGLDYFSFEALSFSELLQAAYWNLISTEFVTMFFIATLFSLSTAMAYMASRHTDENLLENGITPVLAYLAFFVFINGFLWLTVIIKMVAGSERTW
ncbi:MAG: glycosyltransferase family 2 protein [Candidatus Nanohalobium sp.]